MSHYNDFSPEQNMEALHNMIRFNILPQQQYVAPSCQKQCTRPKETCVSSKDADEDGVLRIAIDPKQKVKETIEACQSCQSLGESISQAVHGSCVQILRICRDDGDERPLKILEFDFREQKISDAERIEKEVVDTRIKVLEDVMRGADPRTPIQVNKLPDTIKLKASPRGAGLKDGVKETGEQWEDGSKRRKLGVHEEVTITVNKGDEEMAKIKVQRKNGQSTKSLPPIKPVVLNQPRNRYAKQAGTVNMIPQPKSITIYDAPTNEDPTLRNPRQAWTAKTAPEGQGKGRTSQGGRASRYIGHPGNTNGVRYNTTPLSIDGEIPRHPDQTQQQSQIFIFVSDKDDESNTIGRIEPLDGLKGQLPQITSRDGVITPADDDGDDEEWETSVSTASCQQRPLIRKFKTEEQVLLNRDRVNTTLPNYESTIAAAREAAMKPGAFNLDPAMEMLRKQGEEIEADIESLKRQQRLAQDMEIDRLTSRRATSLPPVKFKTLQQEMAIPLAETLDELIETGAQNAPGFQPKSPGRGVPEHSISESIRVQNRLCKTPSESERHQLLIDAGSSTSASTESSPNASSGTRGTIFESQTDLIRATDQVGSAPQLSPPIQNLDSIGEHQQARKIPIPPGFEAQFINKSSNLESISTATLYQTTAQAEDINSPLNPTDFTSCESVSNLGNEDTSESSSESEEISTASKPSGNVEYNPPFKVPSTDFTIERSTSIKFDSSGTNDESMIRKWRFPEPPSGQIESPSTLKMVVEAQAPVIGFPRSAEPVEITPVDRPTEYKSEFYNSGCTRAAIPFPELLGLEYEAAIISSDHSSSEGLETRTSSGEGDESEEHEESEESEEGEEGEVSEEDYDSEEEKERMRLEKGKFKSEEYGDEVSYAWSGPTYFSSPEPAPKKEENEEAQFLRDMNAAIENSIMDFQANSIPEEDENGAGPAPKIWLEFTPSTNCVCGLCLSYPKPKPQLPISNTKAPQVQIDALAYRKPSQPTTQKQHLDLKRRGRKPASSASDDTVVTAVKLTEEQATEGSSWNERGLDMVKAARTEVERKWREQQAKLQKTEAAVKPKETNPKPKETADPGNKNETIATQPKVDFKAKKENNPQPVTKLAAKSGNVAQPEGKFPQIAQSPGEPMIPVVATRKTQRIRPGMTKADILKAIESVATNQQTQQTNKATGPSPHSTSPRISLLPQTPDFLKIKDSPEIVSAVKASVKSNANFVWVLLERYFSVAPYDDLNVEERDQMVVWFLRTMENRGEPIRTMKEPELIQKVMELFESLKSRNISEAELK
ncbi:hypothetical protein ABW19_dt0202872 [Dactylella cylindrospora]|nr:hypothetical protein ABW19_dt0202872 [Dactylella cylindrospora]